jgi:hypothetical protein
MSVEYFLRVIFTIGAIGTGLAIPSLLLKAKRSVLKEATLPKPALSKPTGQAPDATLE